MDRFWGHALSTAVVAVAAGSAVPACAHNDSTLFVQGVLSPPQPSNNQCIYAVSITAPMINRGTVDASLAGSYAPVFLVGSQLKSRASSDNVKTETSNVSIQGAIVRVVDPTTGAVTMSNTVLSSGLIYAAEGTPSYVAIGATILDSASIKHFDPGRGQPAKLAIAYVKFFGQSLGHQSLESDEFQYPIDVCNGCLVLIPAGDQATQNAYCSGQVAAKTSVSPCVVGQDQLVDCQACFNFSAACKP